MTARIVDTKRCPCCLAWIPSPHGRRELDAHIQNEHPEFLARQQAARKVQP